MKARLIIKSLADLPANVLALAASVPRRAVAATRQAIAPSVRASRRQIREARRRSANVARDIQARATAPFRSAQPWSHGGLNQ